MFQFTPRAAHTLFVLLGVAATLCSLSHSAKREEVKRSSYYQVPRPAFKSCSRNFKKIGCYKDLFRNERTMKHHLVNNRDITSKVFKPPLLDWQRTEEAFHGLACLCAEEAYRRHCRVFGLQFYGECWTSDDAHSRYDMFGEEMDPDRCVMASKNASNPNTLEFCDFYSDEECVGGCATNYVYELEPEEAPPLNGIWTPWGPWDACSATCGPGVKKRKRSCSNGHCLGCEEQYDECMLIRCPINGGFTPWKSGKCSKTCGGGVQQFFRTCTNPRPQYGGRPCRGDLHKTQSCNDFECPIPCHNSMDLAVILDATHSVGRDNFTLSKYFTFLLANAMEVSRLGTHLGIITFHRRAFLELGFYETDKQNSIAIERVLSGINVLSWPTYTDKAIHLANTMLFQEGKGDRPNIPDALIVVTDGRSHHGRSYDAVTRPLKEKHVKIMSVGVGKGIDTSELLEIACGVQENVYHISQYKELFDRLKDIVAASCLEHQYTGYDK